MAWSTCWLVGKAGVVVCKAGCCEGKDDRVLDVVIGGSVVLTFLFGCCNTQRVSAASSATMYAACSAGVAIFDTVGSPFVC